MAPCLLPLRPWIGGTVLWLSLLLGLAMAVPPSTRPLLVYNCAKMPSICRNVHIHNPLQNVPGVPGALGLLNQGNTPNGQDYITLTFDTNAANRRARRRHSCPGRWKVGHGCPEPNQPPTIPSGESWSTGYVGRRWNPNNLQIGQPGYNVIANQFNTGPSGMIWTCDEWPPATTTQGGAGASTYCAPTNGRCGKKLFPNVQGVMSEQDIQGNIHGALRKRYTNTFRNTAPAGTGDFSFQTAWDDRRNAPGAFVQWTNSNPRQQVDSAYRRRSVDDDVVYLTVVYDNGTVATFSRPMTDSEIQEHEEYFKRLLKREGLDSGINNNSTLGTNNNSTNSTVTTPIFQSVMKSPVQQQRFETLPRAPPLPFVDITRGFIERIAHVPVQSYMDRIRATFVDKKQLAPVASPSLVVARQDDNDPPPNCAANSPCVDGSCCNPDVGCGYGKQYCSPKAPQTCTSNCNATALCGRDSKGGSVSCPLDVCCSYYGYCGVGDQFCSSPEPSTPCQAGFGSCSVIEPPTCGGSSALGRSIAYYQVGNNYGRVCQRISPSQIDVAGLTHLNLAFASINPSTFEVVPMDARDVPYYTQFTALKSSRLQTWIAIGGWDFNDPGPTQFTFSKLASSSSSRAAFISSLDRFMSQYGFQGVDLDWEYPGAPDRSGDPADTQNYVSLVREMRAAFGTRYGISLTLPASYWYLRWFDPVAMEPHVDFFGLMTYDLHGPWDKTVADVGPVIVGQTNIPEIYNWSEPLWYDKVDPSKVNMGLAYYGRGYTVEDVNCVHVGCNWTGPSRPAPCTAFGGVMSLQEIQGIVAQLGIQPTLDATAMMKYLQWGDQWIGYDDLETIAMKKAWASSHCYGGTMIWSIDLFSGSGSGDAPDGSVACSTDPGGSSGQQGSSSSGGCGGLVYIDPSIWHDPQPEIHCVPPCTFILPPVQLSTTTTITFPPYVTSLDVAWSEPTGWTHITQTTTLTIPPVTTTAIPVWHHTIEGTDSGTKVVSTFYPTVSVRPPPFVITDHPNPLSSPGVSHPPVTRTITPPPYPYSFTRPTSTTTTTTDVAALLLPIVTFRPGAPGPICKSGCGTPCLLFCSGPCLLDCPDGGHDFADPNDPNPPPRPTPKPPHDNPLPTGSTPSEPFPPGDAGGDEPGNDEEEEDDALCAAEFGLDEPVYVDPDAGAGPGQTILPPAKPTPTPRPPPNPSPPAPNPATEEVHCYNSGFSVPRGAMIEAVTDFCHDADGHSMDADRKGSTTLGPPLEVDGGYIFLSVTATNGCRFTVDYAECGRIFREAIDKCDTSSTQFKQGGRITSNCAEWRIDPNEFE